MKKLNKNGFTLIEVLASVVIMSILTVIMVPSVQYLIDMNNENNYKDLEKGLIQATKVLFSDYRYEVSIEGSCNSNNETKNIIKVGNYSLTESKVPIKVLVDEGNISIDKDGNIINPRNKTQKLNLDTSYVLVKYKCGSKDFSYTLVDTPEEDKSLNWEEFEDV